MAERVKVEQPVLEGFEDLVKPKTFEVYVKSMPKANTQEEIDRQNRELDEIESALEGKSIEDTDLFKRLIAEGMTEVPYEELPFDTEDQNTVEEKKEEPQKEENNEAVEVKKESQEPSEDERYRSEIEEKYELEWWQR